LYCLRQKVNYEAKKNFGKSSDQLHARQEEAGLVWHEVGKAVSVIVIAWIALVRVCTTILAVVFTSGRPSRFGGRTIEY